MEGIRVIKFCSWEKYFLNRINIAREKELSQLKAKKYLDAGCVYFWASTPILMSVLTFITYVWFGNKLTPSKVFTSLALFNMLIGPLNAFPWVINGLVQAWVSIGRVQNFLNLRNSNWLSYYTFDENNSSSSSNFKSLNRNEVLLDIRNADFSWKKKASPELIETMSERNNFIQNETNNIQFNLKNINLKINKGELIGIIGKVGSGKTSILHSILAEIDIQDGRVRLSAENCSKGFAYVSQENWIRAGTIRENILFGADYDSNHYNRVLEACALQQDLSLFPKGDETPVGENGVCLSGGQKARLR